MLVIGNVNRLIALGGGGAGGDQARARRATAVTSGTANGQVVLAAGAGVELSNNSDVSGLTVDCLVIYT